ncbi:hypothetical protein GH714_037547 [Hevea brasiliensis]|uniref:Brix domain-containing protein n=1 Tax=Hevea brasiliensis TaxID=3981 RepID=A0A6A6MML9_HEVBR|nr:hypothetical protein GH714_037547 [Hevea brasiliensis]
MDSSTYVLGILPSSRQLPTCIFTSGGLQPTKLNHTHQNRWRSLTARNGFRLGITGNKGRCYDIWIDFSECMSRCREPKDCALLREDYLECLHHSKENGNANVGLFDLCIHEVMCSIKLICQVNASVWILAHIDLKIPPRPPGYAFVEIVLSGFGSGEQHLKLTTIMFQNIFPAIDINTVKLASCQRVVLLNYNKDTKLIDFRHYSIRLQPVGVSRRIRKFVQKHQVPDLRSLQDVSDFVTKAGYGSESEADDEAATVTLASDLGRVNRASTKSAVKLQDIGPRMTLQLIKVEEGLCSGSVIFSEYGMFIL